MPHWYSQVGVAEIVLVDVQRDAVVLVELVVVGGYVGFEDEVELVELVVGGYVGFVDELETLEELVTLDELETLLLEVVVGG